MASATKKISTHIDRNHLLAIRRRNDEIRELLKRLLEQVSNPPAGTNRWLITELIAIAFYLSEADLSEANGEPREARDEKVREAYEMLVAHTKSFGILHMDGVEVERYFIQYRIPSTGRLRDAVLHKPNGVPSEIYLKLFPTILNVPCETFEGPYTESEVGKRIVAGRVASKTRLAIQP